MTNKVESGQTIQTPEQMATHIAFLGSELSLGHRMHYYGDRIPHMIISGANKNDIPSVEIEFDRGSGTFDCFTFSPEGMNRFTRTGRTVGMEYVDEKISEGIPSKEELEDVIRKLNELKAQLASRQVVSQVDMYQGE